MLTQNPTKLDRVAGARVDGSVDSADVSDRKTASSSYSSKRDEKPRMTFWQTLNTYLITFRTLWSQFSGEVNGDNTLRARDEELFLRYNLGRPDWQEKQTPPPYSGYVWSVLSCKLPFCCLDIMDKQNSRKYKKSYHYKWNLLVSTHKTSQEFFRELYLSSFYEEKFEALMWILHQAIIRDWNLEGMRNESEARREAIHQTRSLKTEATSARNLNECIDTYEEENLIDKGEERKMQDSTPTKIAYSKRFGTPTKGNPAIQEKDSGYHPILMWIVELRSLNPRIPKENHGGTPADLEAQNGDSLIHHCEDLGIYTDFLYYHYHHFIRDQIAAELGILDRCWFKLNRRSGFVPIAQFLLWIASMVTASVALYNSQHPKSI